MMCGDKKNEKNYISDWRLVNSESKLMLKNPSKLLMFLTWHLIFTIYLWFFTIILNDMFIWFWRTGHRNDDHDEGTSYPTGGKSPSWDWWHKEHSKSVATHACWWCTYTDYREEEFWFSWKCWISIQESDKVAASSYFCHLKVLL